MSDSLSPDAGRAMAPGPADASKYHFDFVFDFSDYRALQKSWYRRSRARKIRYVVWIVMIIGAVIILGVPAVYPDALSIPVAVRGFFLGSLAALSAITLLSVVFADFLRKRIFKKTALAGRRVVYDLSDAGFSLTTDGIHSRLVWSTVRRLDVQSERLFLYTEEKQAFVIARRGIAEADWPAAVAFVTERCVKPA